MINIYRYRLTFGLSFLGISFVLIGPGSAFGQPDSQEVRIISGFETERRSQRTRTVFRAERNGDELIIDRRVTDLSSRSGLSKTTEEGNPRSFRNGSTGKSPEVYENGVRIINKRRSYNQNRSD